MGVNTIQKIELDRIGTWTEYKVKLENDKITISTKLITDEKDFKDESYKKISKQIIKHDVWEDVPKNWKTKCTKKFTVKGKTHEKDMIAPNATFEYGLCIAPSEKGKKYDVFEVSKLPSRDDVEFSPIEKSYQIENKFKYVINGKLWGSLDQYLPENVKLVNKTNFKKLLNIE